MTKICLLHAIPSCGHAELNVSSESTGPTAYTCTYQISHFICSDKKDKSVLVQNGKK